jgi:class 3 adenylate cyclase/predicted ATPase
MDVAAWLDSLGLPQYAQAFRDNDIDDVVLRKLTADDLKDIGVSSVGHRRRLLEAIAALEPDSGRDEQTDAEPAPAAGLSVSAQLASTAERRQLTLMFVDLVGSTVLASRLDPEDMSGIIRSYQNAVAGEIARFEGHVAKFMGDGVLAYFGWPQAHEDDAERAVRAGLSIADVVPGLGDSSVPLSARVGIATGLVVVGDLVGEGGAQEEAVIGETPNLAARLQGIAAPGTVVIADSTRRLLGDLFVLSDLGPQPLHGFAQPVQGWHVEGERAADGRFESLRAGEVTPLIGRSHELALLLDRWERAKEGEGQVVLLSGEAGIGKSRIVLALREQLRAEPRWSLRHQCSPYFSNTAFHPIIAQLKRAAGFERDDPPALRLDKLERSLARGTGDVAEAVALVGPLLALDPRDSSPVKDLTPQRRKERTIEVLVEQLLGLARQKPVLCIFEDLHWADPTSLDVIEWIVDRVQTHRVLVVLTFRPEFVPTWHGHSHVTLISLNRLARTQSTELIEKVTGGKPLPPPVLEQILAKTDGVPLFVEELTKAVLESGLLSDIGDRYTTNGPLPPLAVPSTLHDSLMARLDRMAPVKEVAQIGAVIGREFSHELLSRVCSLSPEVLNEALRELASSELVFVRGTPPRATYLFKHALVQDTAYESLLKSKRQLLHAGIARVLEEHWPKMAETEPELLAHHYTEANLVEPAIAYWHRAGQQADERSAYAEAIAHLDNALALIEKLPKGPDRTRLELSVYLTLGSVLMAAKGWGAAEVERVYLHARTLCRESGDAAQTFTVTWGLWLIYQQRCQFDVAKGLLNDLLVLAGQHNDVGLLLQANHAAWTTYGNLPDLERCRHHAQQGIDLYDSVAHRGHKFVYGGHDPGVCSRYNLAMAQWLLGYPDRAASTVREAVALAEETAHPVTLSLALMFAATVHSFRRDLANTQLCAERARALCSQQQIAPHCGAAALILSGWTRALNGGEQDGIAEIQAGLQAHRASGVALRVPHYLSLLAEAFTRMSRYDEAVGSLREAQEVIEQTGERRWEAEIYRLQGALLRTRSGSHDEAEDLFRRALVLAREQGARSLELRAATSLGRLWAERHEQHKAQDLLAGIYGWFTEGLETPDLQEARTLLGELA